MKDIFQLIIPGSTSNVGPGYDTLGIALSIYNRITVEPGGKGVRIAFAPEIGEIFREKILGMVEHTVSSFLTRSEIKEPNAKLTFANEVPIARGLGSSATFRMGTLIALNRLVGEPLDKDALLYTGCTLERHTENCVASVTGGLTASGFIGDKIARASYSIARGVAFVAAIPEKPVSTSELRKLVPTNVSMKDAVSNLNRTAILINALARGEFQSLHELLDDRFHQPYRAKVITPLYDVIAAARKAGAWGGFLSGSGSTIIAIATERHRDVGAAMKKVLDDEGWPSSIQILKPDNQGIRAL